MVFVNGQRKGTNPIISLLYFATEPGDCGLLSLGVQDRACGNKGNHFQLDEFQF